MEIRKEDINIQIWHKDKKIPLVPRMYNGIKVKHIPTGIVVKVDTERSQHKNKAIALDMLRTGLKQCS